MTKWQRTTDAGKKIFKSQTITIHECAEPRAGESHYRRSWYGRLMILTEANRSLGIFTDLNTEFTTHCRRFAEKLRWQILRTQYYFCFFFHKSQESQFFAVFIVFLRTRKQS